jgi:hypothetical protein
MDGALLHGACQYTTARPRCACRAPGSARALGRMAAKASRCTAARLHRAIGHAAVNYW